MSEPLTDQDREALTAWVFALTDAEVISDPDFRPVVQIVAEHVEQARADERERVRHWMANCRYCGTRHHYDEYVGVYRTHQLTTGMAPSMGWTCVCGCWCDRIEDWHDHLTGVGEDE